MASDSVVGKFVLCLTLSIFLYYFFWVSILPFMLVDEDNWIHSLFPPIGYAFAIPAIFGVVFLGGLSLYTLYKIHPSTIWLLLSSIYLLARSIRYLVRKFLHFAVNFYKFREWCQCREQKFDLTHLIVNVDKMANQWLIIGISGVTCSGKTTLANSLYDFFISCRNNQLTNTSDLLGEVYVVSQDDYFRPINDSEHTWIEELNHINWELLSALDMNKMITDIQNILKDNVVLYDSKSFRSSFQEQQQKINILIIEGFLIFNHRQLWDLCQVKFHLHLPYEKCFQRRKARVYTPADVTGYFEMCVWPMYEKHFREFKDSKELLVLNGEISKERIFKYALTCINKFL